MAQQQESLEESVRKEIKILDKLCTELTEIRDVLHSEDVDDLSAVKKGIHTLLEKAAKDLKEAEESE